jgi:hypothetical protein
MTYVNEVYCHRIAYPDKLGEKVFIGIPALSKHDTLIINGFEVQLPDEYFIEGREIPMKPEDLK